MLKPRRSTPPGRTKCPWAWSRAASGWRCLPQCTGARSACVWMGVKGRKAAGLPAIGCCFLFLSAATRHTDAWQRARVQAGSSTQSSDYRDAGSSTSSCESAPSSSCRSSCHRVPAGRIWGCHWTAIRRCGAPPMWFAACRSPWASCQQNWTWPWLPTVANRATVGSQAMAPRRRA